ncbi:MAG: tetratricopeptide repeat protein [Fibromonadales bacterium]|nr:tetratricopeptide repeat protein [Fibromonadales bacterium]
MKVLFSLIGFALCLLLSSCGSITAMRTKEIRESTDKVNARLDSLIRVIDSLQTRNMSRSSADISELSSRITALDDKSEVRMEEITFRLDRILGIVQQKSVVTKSGAGEKSAEHERKSQEMESLYNASRSDYLRGEYAVAYNGFKQIYESLKTGEMAENALYWMGMCMLDAGRKENATILFKSLLDNFPKSPKVCTVNFKLASMAEAAGNKEGQKVYLQKLLGTGHCTSSNEFQRAAEILSP